MTVLSGPTIRGLCHPFYQDRGDLPMIAPFEDRQQHEPTGTSFGLSMCGYDIRLDQDVELSSEYEYQTVNGSIIRSSGPLLSWHLVQGPRPFALASTMEQFAMPLDVVGIVHDKSTWARRAVAVQNTVIEPGWRGFLTLELTYAGHGTLKLPAGTPIAQVLFHKLDKPVEGYSGKYQDQRRGPQEAL